MRGANWPFVVEWFEGAGASNPAPAIIPAVYLKYAKVLMCCAGRKRIAAESSAALSWALLLMYTASKLGPHTQTDRGTCPGVGL